MTEHSGASQAIPYQNSQKINFRWQNNLPATGKPEVLYLNHCYETSGLWSTLRQPGTG